MPIGGGGGGSSSGSGGGADGVGGMGGAAAAAAAARTTAPATGSGADGARDSPTRFVLLGLPGCSGKSALANRISTPPAGSERAMLLLSPRNRWKSGRLQHGPGGAALRKILLGRRSSFVPHEDRRPCARPERSPRPRAGHIDQHPGDTAKGGHASLFILVANGTATIARGPPDPADVLGIIFRKVVFDEDGSKRFVDDDYAGRSCSRRRARA